MHHHNHHHHHHHHHHHISVMELDNFLIRSVLTYPEVSSKVLLEDHYIKIWNDIYVKSENASHTKLYIPTIFHRLSFTLWPIFLLTQFLTNHGSFRSYLYKMNKTTSPYCNCPAKTVPFVVVVVDIYYLI